MRRLTGPHLRLDERDVGQLDLDDHLARPSLGRRHFGRLEHFGGPELPHDHRPHSASLTGAILSDSDLIGLFHSG